MYLYPLSLRDYKGAPRYDFYDSFIIAARSEHEARKEAAKASADEGEDVWLDSIYSVCDICGEAAPHINLGVVLGSFNAG